MDESSFYRKSAEGFVATALTRGPWDNRFQHGGPPCALVTREIERIAASHGWPLVVRVTFELIRPVPISVVSVNVSVDRAGRSAGRLRALLEADGKPVVTATALALREASSPATLQTPKESVPAVAEATPFSFPFFLNPVGYHSAMELRLARGEFRRGPTTMWMRARVPLVEGEITSPLCRVVTAADSGNGVSPILDWTRHSFVNPDLSVAIHRRPEGEWICLDARTDIGPGGVGTAQSRIHDERGPVGYGVQSLLIVEAPRQ